MGSLKLSALICGYSTERATQLRAAVVSVREQEYAAFEIIVVIDHNPELKASLTNAFPDILVVENAGQKGLSGARNTGIAAATGDVIAFMDDDAVADRLWLLEMARTFQDEKVIGMGGAIIPAWPGAKPKWMPDEFLWVFGCSFRGQPKTPAEIRNPIGCNMGFRRKAFDEAGGFQTGFGRLGDDAAGCEETEMSIRLKRTIPEGKIVYNPHSVVHHQIAAARLSWHYFWRRCASEGRSKWALVKLAGAGDGLSSERAYVLRTLPNGFLHGIADTVFRFDPFGVVRSANLAIGLTATTAGYLKARWHRSSEDVKLPVRSYKICDIELSAPWPTVEMRDPVTAREYGGLYCLVRRYRRPVGMIECEIEGPVVSASQLQALVTRSVEPGLVELADPIRLPPNPPPMTVVIATRNRAGSLAACLDSLLKQNYSQFDIVVVDNATSTRETEDLIAGQYRSSGRVKYVREDIPGLGRAHNCGLQYVTGTLVAFTDDDVIADPDWLAALASAFGSTENVGCVTGLIFPAELETRAQVWTEKHGAFGKGFARRIFDLEQHRDPGALYPYAAGQFGSGANMAFRTDALKSIGGFDAALGAGTIARGGDDLASFLAIVQAGYKLVYEPAAVVWHYHRRGEDGMRRQAFGYGIGLGAYLTKQIVDRPATIFSYLKVLPAGLAHLLGSDSAKNRRLPADYPAGLTWRERAGVIAGVPAYLISRMRTQRNPDPHRISVKM